MKARLEPGKYIVAVSGGVDSMVLLHLVCQLKGLELVVAHFDHGMRPDSASDAVFVEATARHYGQPFELGQAKLGKTASEAAARTARYSFLAGLMAKHGADKIVTAHHQDDLIETAIINLLRGTGPRGLSAITANAQVARPLISFSKAQLIGYAKANGLTWREDPSNRELTYLRNRVRAKLLPSMTPADRAAFLEHIEQVIGLEAEMAALLQDCLSRLMPDNRLDRAKYAALPANVGRALIHNFLQARAYQVDRTMIKRLDMAIRSGRAGHRYNLPGGGWLNLDANLARFDLPR